MAIRGYRSWQRGEETIFPLELMLGLVENVSPAMLDWIGETIAAASMSQQATIDAIKQSSGVSMGCSDCVAAPKTGSGDGTTSPGKPSRCDVKNASSR